MMNRLTRKDFRRAAEQLSEWADGPDGKLFTKEDVVYEFIKFFEDTNANFDASKFAKACRHPERLR